MINHKALRCMGENLACRLKKSLYGLKQVSMAWYERIDAYLHQMGFRKSDVDQNLYFIMVGDDAFILFMYVDDMFITGEDRLIQ